MGMAGSTSAILSSSHSKRHSTCNLFLFGEVLEDLLTCSNYSPLLSRILIFRTPQFYLPETVG
jgi:hypothetical protein